MTCRYGWKSSMGACLPLAATEQHAATIELQAARKEAEGNMNKT